MIKNDINPTPPIAILRFLSWFCPDHLYEEIEGDLIQKFNRDVTKFGERKAKTKLVWNTIRFIRPGILMRNTFSIELNQLRMLQNYFKIAYRHLAKSRTFSFINILGLAVGMSAFLLIIQYVRFERSYENFHNNSANINRIALDIYKGSEYVITDCEMYAPIGPILKRELPEVIDFVRMYENGNLEVKVGDKKFYEKRIYMADPSIFTVFSYTVLHGDKTTALSEPFQTAITESKAKKYFGRVDAIGESIEIGNNLYTITAILEDVPANTHLKFDFLLSHATISKLWNYNEDEFQGNNEYLYLLMADGTNLIEFNEKLKRISLRLKDKIGDDRIVADAMQDIHLYSNKSYEPEPNGNARSVYFLLIIAIFILVIAWINYVNLSTARAVERAREVGIRKVMGSLRSQLIFQFLSESTIITFLSSGLAIILVYLCFPFFTELTGQALPLDLFKDREFWYLFLALILSGSLLAGLYPAFILSSFEPVSVLKGKFRSSVHGQWLRKGLVIFQFASTVILIACMCTVYLQVSYLQKYKLGMNIEQMLVLKAPTLASDSIYHVKSQTLRKELHANPAVQTIAFSGGVPGLSLQGLSTTGNVFRYGQEHEDKGYIYYINNFDETFIPAFKMELVAGRNFEGNESVVDQLIINEEAMYTLGFENAAEAVGAKLLFYGDEKTVIGVLKNFHHRSPKEKHLPMVFWYSNYAEYFSLRVNTDHIQATLASVKATWNKVYPDSPFEYFFLDETYNQQYKADQHFGQVIATFSTIAALIACLGLFGLSSFTITRRMKEIGIRKVLGATVTQIVSLLSRDLISLVLIASAIALPSAYFLMEDWLSNYAVRIDLNAWVFVVPLILILLISMLTVSFQTFKAAQTNASETLKHE